MVTERLLVHSRFGGTGEGSSSLPAAPYCSLAFDSGARRPAVAKGLILKLDFLFIIPVGTVGSMAAFSGASHQRNAFHSLSSRSEERLPFKPHSPWSAFISTEAR